MAKILCGISGIEFTCDHLPIYLQSREYAHPVFFLNPKKLLGLYQKYRHQELDSTSSYLVFLAYLNSTDLLEWRVPAQRTPQTDALIANHFESLVSICEKMSRVKNPSLTFSQIAITPDTKTLSSLPYWIESWEQTYNDFTSGYANEKHKKDIADLESKLLFMSRDANRSETQYASRLAEWADKAGCFPHDKNYANGQWMPTNAYWKQIIRKCVNQESIFSIPSDDLEKVIEHCEEYIDAGSTYGFDLFKILREGKEKQASFLGLGDFNFTIIEKQDTTVEEANKIAIISNAPTEAPRRIDYPTNFAFLKAKLAWDMAQNAVESKKEKGEEK